MSGGIVSENLIKCHQMPDEHFINNLTFFKEISGYSKKIVGNFNADELSRIEAEIATSDVLSGIGVAIVLRQTEYFPVFLRAGSTTVAARGCV